MKRTLNLFFCLLLAVNAFGGNVFGIENVAVPNPPLHPQYGTFTGIDAVETSLYDLAIDNMCLDLEEDGTFRTGVLWGGVWTRDVSYSIILSLAHVEPIYAKNSLLRKVDRLGRIIQDTGTGGAWPVSIDREIWIVAAYELWLETGDQEWLEQIYAISARSIRDDYATAYNPETGLFRGESSFIDWRHQSYPEWTDCKDIRESECLGTNAVFAGALRSLAKMAEALGKADEAADYTAKAEDLSAAINKWLWLPDKGYYSQYRYGRNARVASPRSETLGEALCVLFDVATPEQAKSIFANVPVCEFGPTIFWPQIATQRPYHNNGIWPFVTAYYAVAASKAGSHAGEYFGIMSNSTYVAEYGSWYENRVSSDGGLETCTNSPRQLWSIAGGIGTTRKLLLGINYEPDGIAFTPDIPSELKGTRSLKNLAYRGMTLDITVSGEGNVVKSFKLDGNVSDKAFVPATLTGRHTVEVEVEADPAFVDVPVSVQPYTADLCTPEASISGKVLSWNTVEGADHYKVILNGEVVADNVAVTRFKARKTGEYSVIAVKEDGVESFMSEPVRKYGKEFTFATGAAEIAMEPGAQYNVTVKIPRRGEYAIDWLYSNGNGEIETQNKCAVRTMAVDGQSCGTVVFAQRGRDDWESQGWSNSVKVKLRRGSHVITVSYPEENVNMNIDEDRAILHEVRFTKL